MNKSPYTIVHNYLIVIKVGRHVPNLSIPQRQARSKQRMIRGSMEFKCYTIPDQTRSIGVITIRWYLKHYLISWYETIRRQTLDQCSFKTEIIRFYK